MITSSVNRVIYKGNGSATEFAYPFKIFERTDLKVLLIDKDGNRNILTTDYYVDMDNKKVLYPGYVPGAEKPLVDRPLPLAYGETLVLYRDIPIVQMDKMPETYPFDVNERMHDRACVISQQLKDAVDRGVSVSVDAPVGFVGDIPIVPGMSFRVSSDGLCLESTEDPARVLPIAEVYMNDAKGYAQSAHADANQTESNYRSVVEIKDTFAQTVRTANAALAQTRDAYQNELGNKQIEVIGAIESAVEVGKENALNTINTKLQEVETITADAESYANNASANADRAYAYMMSSLSVPVGVSVFYAGNGDIPHGFRLCDGSNMSKTEYPDLFNVIGYTNGGSGDTFKLPYMLDLFVQGSDVAGVVKEAGLPNIWGKSNFGSSACFLDRGEHGAIYTVDDMYNGVPSPTSTKYNVSKNFEFDASRSNSIYGNSDTVQPPAITLRPIIRVLPSNETETESAVIKLLRESIEELRESKVNKDNPRMTDTAIVRLDNLNADGNTESVWGNVLAVEDKQGKWFAYWQAENHGWNQENYSGLRVVNGDAKASLGLTVKPNGYAYAEAPTPDDNANGVEIATTQWVNRKVNQQSDEIVALDNRVTDLENKPSGASTDVQINGASITQNGVANIPIANSDGNNNLGLVKSGANAGYGVGVLSSGHLHIQKASNTDIDNRQGNYAPIVATRLDYAVKQAMCDGKGASWTDEERKGAWKRFSIIKTTLDEIAIAGAGYFLGVQTNVNITLPDDAEVGQEISVSWYNGDTPATLSIDGDMLDFDYTPSANSRSEINALWDGMYWAIIGNEMGVAND